MLAYLICAAAYLALLLASFTLWRRRIAGSALAAAFGAQSAWAVAAGAAASDTSVPFLALMALECVRGLAWCLVLARALGRSADPALGRTAVRVLAGVTLAALVALAATGLLAPVGSALDYLVRVWLWSGLALAVIGLVLVEQVARNTRASHQWELKHLWLAIGAIFTFDLCLFSIFLVRGGIEPALWAARGVVNVLPAGLLAVSLHRMRVWQSETFLSPRIAFFNTTLLAAACYVLAIAAVSYFIGVLGGTWGTVAQAAFLAGGVLLFAVAALSHQFRAWLRVMLTKHLLPYRYDYRREWQRLTRALSESADAPVYERIAAVMASFVECASGGLWLRDAQGDYVPAGGALAPAGAAHVAGADAFLAHLRDHEWIYDLEDLRSARPQQRLPAPPQWLLADTRIWLVVPLVCAGNLVGFVAVGQPLARAPLTWEELDLLRAAGRQVASFLAFEQAAKRLAEAQQFEAVNRLSAVLMHDLRHLIAQQALVVENAARHRRNPEFVDDAILTIENCVQRMNRLMEELRSGVLTEMARRVELGELCSEVAQRCAARAPGPVLSVQDRGLEVVVNRERLQSVLEHLVRNAQDATPPSGSISLIVRRAAQRAVVEVSDTGAGMDEQFIRTRLFRPFETTKGSEGMGIGAYDAREFVRKCGGDIQVRSEPGRGTTFTVSLPLAPPLAAPLAAAAP